ncbi:hypothetical protein TNCV_746671 [Trichonephila clavipes]|nr:hypothetical protein TNCV_746671 [Trichonephila clavipes]
MSFFGLRSIRICFPLVLNGETTFLRRWETLQLSFSTGCLSSASEDGKLGELKQYQPYEEFADRRFHSVARTYFYLDEAQCEKKHGDIHSNASMRWQQPLKHRMIVEARRDIPCYILRSTVSRVPRIPNFNFSTKDRDHLITETNDVGVELSVLKDKQHCLNYPQESMCPLG